MIEIDQVVRFLEPLGRMKHRIDNCDSGLWAVIRYESWQPRSRCRILHHGCGAVWQLPYAGRPGLMAGSLSMLYVPDPSYKLALSLSGWRNEQSLLSEEVN